jgi:hypothetical protein
VCDPLPTGAHAIPGLSIDPSLALSPPPPHHNHDPILCSPVLLHGDWGVPSWPRATKQLVERTGPQVRAAARSGRPRSAGSVRGSGALAMGTTALGGAGCGARHPVERTPLQSSISLDGCCLLSGFAMCLAGSILTPAMKRMMAKMGKVAVVVAAQGGRRVPVPPPAHRPAVWSALVCSEQRGRPPSLP